MMIDNSILLIGTAVLSVFVFGHFYRWLTAKDEKRIDYDPTRYEHVRLLDTDKYNLPFAKTALSEERYMKMWRLAGKVPVDIDLSERSWRVNDLPESFAPTAFIPDMNELVEKTIEVFTYRVGYVVHRDTGVERRALICNNMIVQFLDEGYGQIDKRRREKWQ